MSENKKKRILSGIQPSGVPHIGNFFGMMRQALELQEKGDGVVAALTNLSRERAQALFREGLVEIDYEPAPKPDQQLEAGCIVVIRGKGKFIIRSLSEQTKKGRARLQADKYL